MNLNHWSCQNKMSMCHRASVPPTFNNDRDEFDEELLYVVYTRDGPVRGYVDKRDEDTYYKFKSIPYAKPPTGCLRFMPPSPIKPWTEVMDCTKDAPLPMCFSFNHEIVGSEDCLYLEVSTAAMSPDTPLPVMFWVGGCGFAWYMDDICDPTLLIDQNVIFVRCGFRLGPFGFLSINDYTAPGNNGLKDIVLALKWVQRNISAFGGDPQNVTLFGNSSGGACIHLLILSPMASGLFHKAILQSASALNNWSLAKNPHQPVMELAKQLGVTKTCKMEIIEELKSIPALKLMQALYALEIRVLELDKNDTFDSIFKPCIEEEFEGQPAFLTKSPPIIIKSGNFNKVPFIIGSNNIEGSVIQFIKSDFYTDFKKYNENLGLIVPRPLVGDSTVSKAIGQQLLRFYLDGEESLTEDTRNQYLQLLSDYYFLYYVNKTVQLHSQFAPECPIYYYVINSAGEWSVPDNLKFLNSLGHCAEYPFVFRLHCDNHSNSSAIKGSRDSILMRSRIVKMWTNFAKYSDPTPNEEDPLLQIKWDPVQHKDKLNYLSIGSELTKGRNPFYDRMTFWDKLHEEHKFLRVLIYFNDIGVSW